MKKLIFLISVCFSLNIVSFGQQDNLQIQREKIAISDTPILYIGVVNQFELVLPFREIVDQVRMNKSNIKVQKNCVDISVFTTGINTLYVFTNKQKYSIVFNSSFLNTEAKKLKRTSIVL